MGILPFFSSHLTSSGCKPAMECCSTQTFTAECARHLVAGFPLPAVYDALYSMCSVGIGICILLLVVTVHAGYKLGDIVNLVIEAVLDVADLVEEILYKADDLSGQLL